MPKKSPRLPSSSPLQLRSIALRPPPERLAGRYPFDIPIIQSLLQNPEQVLELGAPVTIFVGENGSGKSTLIEALACAAKLVVVGSEDGSRDNSLAHVRPLADCLRLTWNRRSQRGFFLRAEDFFGYARRMARIRQELEEDLRTVDREYADRPEAIDYARMPYQSELAGIQQRYGEGLDHASHGEAFLRLFQSRFVPGGLYLLDEPEAPLSPVRQLALLATIHKMVASLGLANQESQFIIATHSPILMAYPGAHLLSFDGDRIHPVQYEDLEHVNLTRDFLNNPQAYLRKLIADD
jgi:predicted ATPase